MLDLRRAPRRVEKPIPARPANLTRAKLGGADLSSATLTRANLTDAEVAGADLRNARLEGADLTRVDLGGATR